MSNWCNVVGFVQDKVIFVSMCSFQSPHLMPVSLRKLVTIFTEHFKSFSVSASFVENQSIRKQSGDCCDAEMAVARNP